MFLSYVLKNVFKNCLSVSKDPTLFEKQFFSSWLVPEHIFRAKIQLFNERFFSRMNSISFLRTSSSTKAQTRNILCFITLQSVLCFKYPASMILIRLAGYSLRQFKPGILFIFGRLCCVVKVYNSLISYLISELVS